MRITNTEYTNNHKKDYFKEMPVAIVCDLEKYELSRSERVHGLSCVSNFSSSQKLNHSASQIELQWLQVHRRSCATWSLY